MKQPTCIELFAGAGGMALGLEQAGFRHLALVEADKQAVQTLLVNRPDWPVICDDIKHVSFKSFKNKVNVVTGGPPCQSFSYAGKKRGFGDARGTLFNQYVRCVKQTRPDMFIFENVPGMVSHDSGRTFKTITTTLANCGYWLQYEILNAADYGVPQTRQRLIMIGTRYDLGADVFFQYPAADRHQINLDGALKNVPASDGAEYAGWEKKIFDQIPPGGNWRNLPGDVAKKYMGPGLWESLHDSGNSGVARRLAWDKPAPTLTCHVKGKVSAMCHPDVTRPLTVREAARIQTFPDDWAFTGSLTAQYRQIGNAVPVKLAYRIGLEVKTALTAGGLLGE